MKYIVFIDESGNADVRNPDTRFPVFVLCGVLFREDHLDLFEISINDLKEKHFGSHDIIFHSVKMRKHEGRFCCFQDPGNLALFYQRLEPLFADNIYTIFAAIVNKEKYKAKYLDKNTAYQDCLTFLCERIIMYLDKKGDATEVQICIEKRDKSLDRYLKKHFAEIRANGSKFMPPKRLQIINPHLDFKDKLENVNGLQFADLCAYPIARRTLNPENQQLTFELFKNCIYRRANGDPKGYGLKYFP